MSPSSSRACKPSDLLSVPAQDSLVRSVIEYQIAHGASGVIAPYVHVDQPTLGGSSRAARTREPLETLLLTETDRARRAA